jgi:sugar lactone lactonase YvrE
MSEPTVEVLYNGKARLGEGPCYDHVSGELIFVDILDQTVNFLNLETQQNRSVSLPASVSAAVPVEGQRDQVVVTVGRRICLMHRVSGELHDLSEVDQDKPHNRFNDAKCDPQGRLWAGTMHDGSPATGFDAGQGFLYMYSKGALTRKMSGVTVSNGMAWNRDQSKMYYVDSDPRKVYTLRYSSEDGEISDQKVFRDYSEDEKKFGNPDGMTIDTDDNVWVASFGGETGITCWSPAGECIREIPIPCPCVTSCCFGGPEFSWLFVTSSREYLSEEMKRTFPHAGAVFVVKNLGVRGCPNYYFKL